MAARVSYTVRHAKRTDIPAMGKYIDLEGWDIDINILYCMYDMDSRAWYVAETEEGEIIGFRGLAYFTPSVAAGGVYIVKKELRGLGIGRAVNQEALKTLGDSTIINLSATMVSLYTKDGFVVDFEIDTKRGRVSILRDALVKMNLDTGVNMKQFKPDMKQELELYDSKICGHQRPYYFQTWILGHSKMTLLAYQDKRLVGYGCLNSRSFGIEIAPLYADSDVIAWILLKSLLEQISEEKEVFLYVCKVNQKMLKFVQTLPLKNVITLSKMNFRGKVSSQMEKVYSLADLTMCVV